MFKSTDVGAIVLTQSSVRPFVSRRSGNTRVSYPTPIPLGSTVDCNKSIAFAQIERQGSHSYRVRSMASFSIWTFIISKLEL